LLQAWPFCPDCFGDQDQDPAGGAMEDKKAEK
jgi:hypothetical protein